MLPELVSHLLHGERPPHAPASLRLRELTGLPGQGGWALLGERPGEELARGLVGKFWRPVIEYAHVPAERFRDSGEPGYAKTIYALSVRPLADGRSLLSGLMRTATTDEHACRWFRRSWTFGVGSGAHILVHALLEMIRQTAEDAEAAEAEQARREPGRRRTGGTRRRAVPLAGPRAPAELGCDRRGGPRRLPRDELLDDADAVAPG